MEKLTSKQIRQMWLDFWAAKGHQIVPSKSLVPVNDPSLLWINSGVATLKDYFTGRKRPKNPRLTNSQKSIRTNDIENVGVTARHHTLFEMLGNFSIGDYFKNEALTWAHELLFDVFRFPKEKIYFTYYEDDKDAYDCWTKLGVEPSHLIKGSRKTNFWDVGQGPCGPCTEIFYDRGAKYDTDNIGIRLLREDIENDRYVEIWNIVFSQFNNDGHGHYGEMRQKNIDTGAGLERITAIFQDAPTNFDTDLFLPIIHAMEQMSTSHYEINDYFRKNPQQSTTNRHFRIVADHLRAVTLAIQDGVTPSNSQRGYIIRRLIRRAYRSGLALGAQGSSFLYRLVSTVATVMDVFPIDVKHVQDIIRNEELAFANTIDQGQDLLMHEIVHLPKKEPFPFATAFRLFETYGFPIELTQEILAEKGIALDISAFDAYKAQHAAVSRQTKVQGMDSQVQVIQTIKESCSTFVGYEISTDKAVVANVLFHGVEHGKHYVLLDNTPFYPGGGGQVHDIGTIDGHAVENVFRDKHDNIWHVLLTWGNNDKVVATIDGSHRHAAMRNHSATHLLATALRHVFGNGIVQLGSDNNAERLRFDFPLVTRPSEETLAKIERLVNDYIAANHQRKYIETTFSKGQKMGAIALPDEDYGENVRVVDFGISIEFCGGTHVARTAAIEAFKIVRFESKGAGVFRIEAVTSRAAVKAIIDAESASLKVELARIVAKNKQLDAKYKAPTPRTILGLQKALVTARDANREFVRNLGKLSTDDFIVDFTTYQGMKAYINLKLSSSSIVKATAIALREKHPDTTIIVGAQESGKTVVAITCKKGDAKRLWEEIASRFGGRGGGNATFAMGTTVKPVEVL